MAQLVEKFNQTPWQLGFTEDKDVSLLYRCLKAMSLFRLAQRVAADVEQVSFEEMYEILPYQNAIDEILTRPTH